MTVFDWLLVGGAMAGHVALWTAVLDRLHASGLHHTVSKKISRSFLLVLTLGPLVMLLSLLWRPFTPRLPADGSFAESLRLGYFAACWLLAVVRFVPGLGRRLWKAPCPALESNHTEVVDAEARTGEKLSGGPVVEWFARLPSNQLFTISVHDKRLKIRGLDPALDGLSIVHLSDLHFTGRVRERYFHEAVEIANSFDADLVALTGDLIDKEHCFDWIPRTLGRLRSRHGSFYVFGNHDKRVDVARLRSTLADSGIRDLVGRREVVDIRGRKVALAGTSRPWFPDEPELDAPEFREAALRILLSHTPDQWPLAQRHGCELMLAGHTHGGQIRLPFIGPVFSCSRYGGKYIAGVYHLPPTVLHTSRGLSGVEPMRFGCPPELTRLVLTRDAG